MDVTVRHEKEAWLMQFNPCGVEPVNGYVELACPAADCMSVHCMLKGSYIMAKYLITQGITLKKEGAAFEKHLQKNMLGKEVVNIEGETVKVTEDNIQDLLKGVTGMAGQIVEGVDMCVRMSTPLTQEYLSQCTGEQYTTLIHLGIKSEEMKNFQGGQLGAQLKEEEMQKIVEKALDLGLGELGLVARFAIALGYGDRVPQYATSPLLFKYPRKDGLQPRPRV